MSDNDDENSGLRLLMPFGSDDSDDEDYPGVLPGQGATLLQVVAPTGLSAFLVPQTFFFGRPIVSQGQAEVSTTLLKHSHYSEIQADASSFDAAAPSTFVFTSTTLTRLRDVQLLVAQRAHEVICAHRIDVR